MGAIGKTTRGVKSTVRAGKSAVHSTVSWPFALFFGPLYDIRLRRKSSEADLSPQHAAARRRMEGATGARWVSAIGYITAIALVIWHSEWLLAPLIPVAWVILARRSAWWRGQPTLRRMLSPGAWVTAGLSLIPVTVALLEMLFEPFDGELRGWLVHGSGWLAVVIALISALSVAERLKRPEPATEGRTTDAEFMASLVGMTGAALDAALERKEFAVGRSGEQLHAVYPLGVEAKLNRETIEVALRERSASWQFAARDLDARRLTLEPVTAKTRAAREALALSAGLVDGLLEEDQDGGQPSVGLDWGRFN